MKKILQILLLFLVGIPLNAIAQDNYLGTDTSLKFGGTKYTLGWSSHPEATRYIQEYFPKGQSPEKFTDMLSVWVIVGDITAKQYIHNLANNYEARKKTDKSCNYKTYEKGDERMFDGIISEDDGKFINAMEFNVYRCKNVVVDGKSALLICFYSGQATGDDVDDFLKNLGNFRNKKLEAMIKFEYPTISLK